MTREKMDIRLATLGDLDFITQTQVEAFPDDPQWDYRFPKRKEYPEDTYHFTKVLFKSLLEAPTKFTVMVACSKANEDPNVVKPGAHAIWSTANIYEPDGSTHEWLMTRQEKSAGERQRRDANPEHIKAFTKALEKAKKEYFDDVYGAKQIHLMILGTHPDYRNRGAATKLAQWGLDIAKKYEIATTVFGSPMGTNLYTYLGFKLLGVVTVQVEGEEESCQSQPWSLSSRRVDSVAFEDEPISVARPLLHRECISY